jgi:dTDP-4-dehydrorhamnose 3,5-epimerase
MTTVRDLSRFFQIFPDCYRRSVKKFTDERGYLRELFRVDELPVDVIPAMGYLSVTHPNVIRGPHEHVEQTDVFVFASGLVKVSLWENRKGSVDYWERYDCIVGEENPILLIVPPGVVHGYQNIGSSDALILNFPTSLYAGWNQEEEVDEIRWELKKDHPFVL